jgi:hypothetical protein
MKSRTIDSLLKTPKAFENLLGMCLLFDKNSDYYKFSGFVTAALLDFDDLDKNISILAIKTADQWYTFKYSREDLKKMFSYCIEFVGKTEEDSFTIQ